MNTFPSGILITGIGAMTPLGATMAENWRAVLERRTAISRISRLDLGGIACQSGGIISDADASSGALATSFALAAVREAISQSGADAKCLGLVTGSNFGEADAIPCDHSEVARNVAAALSIGGPVASISLSCSSGASAIALAADWIRCGRADAVAVVGVDAITLCAWSGLCSLRTMARDGVVKPFDVNRGGTVFAEGAAAVVLERAEIAQARGAESLAELRGWATGNNGFHLTAPPARAEGSRRVMADAIASAGCPINDIALVSAHATATKANDLTESQALEDIFGNRLATLPVTAVKASSGHLLGAAGVFEAAIAVLSLREGIAPPIARTPDPDPALPALDLVTDTPRRLSGSIALTDSAGFGGCNAALVLAKPCPPPHAPGPGTRTTGPSRKKRIAICASGFVSALGIGAEEAEATWAEGESACFPSPGIPAPQGVADDTAGVVPPFDPDTVLPSPKAYLDRQCLLAMSAAALAMRNGRGAIAPDRFGVSHGTAWGAAETLTRFWNDCREKGPRLVKPMLFPHTYANAASSLISIEWELRGFHANFAGGSNASSFAIAAAVDALRRGEADAVLAGGSEALSQDRWASTAQSSSVCPPGEGAAVFLLQREDDVADGAQPLSFISGTGISGAGNASVAVGAALAEAGIEAGAVSRLYSAPGIAQQDILPAATRIIPEEMTGLCGGASCAVQLACALLEPLFSPAVILTSDETGTFVALVVSPLI